MTTEKQMQTIIHELQLIDLGNAASYLERATSASSQAPLQPSHAALPAFLEWETNCIQDKKKRELSMLMRTLGLISPSAAGSYLEKASSHRDREKKYCK